MKQKFKQHKTLWISLLIALIAALVTIGAVACAIAPAVRAEAIATTAMERIAHSEQGADDMAPVPTAVPPSGDDLARRIASAAWYREVRRQGRIPVADNSSVRGYSDAGWSEQTVSEAAKAAAVQVAAEWLQKTIGDSFGDLVTVQRYSDPKGYRKNIVQVRDEDDVHVVTMDEETFTLINADTSSTAGMETYAGTESLKALEERLTKQLADNGMTVVEVEPWYWTGWEESDSLPTGFATASLQFKLTDERVVGIAVVLGKVVSFSVYPDKECAEEGAYFPADVKRLGKYVEKVAGAPRFTPVNRAEMQNPENIRSGEARDLLLNLYRFATGSEAQGQITVQGYRDETGLREDYWEVALENRDIWMHIGARSGHVIAYGSTIALRDKSRYDLPVRFDDTDDWDMIEETYVSYVKDLAPYYNACCQSPIKKVDMNAAYDYHCVTVDIELEDGTIYEVYFENGALRNVQYFANGEAFFEGVFNKWEVDGLARNLVTGETFFSNEAAFYEP